MTASRSIPPVACAALCWIAAAVAVGLSQTLPLHVAAIAAAAFVCMRAGRWRHASEWALLVGAGWLLLSVAAEMVATKATGRPWHALLGRPDTLQLVAWAAAPLLFARRG